MESSLVAVRVGRSGRSYEPEQWERVYKDDIEFWEKATEVIGTWSYTHNNMRVSIECDFSSLAELHRLNYRINHAARHDMELARELIESSMDAIVEFFVKVTLEGEEDLSKYKWYCSFFAEKYLYDVFFMMNVSRPGVCDFLNMRIDSGVSGFTDMKISGSFFESSLLHETKKGTIAPITLPLLTVASWYRALNTGFSQKADSGVEKAVFSLLHICCGNDIDIAFVVWVFHALEAIYGTKIGESFTNLNERISTLLELDTHSKGSLKRNLRDMYDCRSSFVHGGYKVPHPMKNEVMDERLNSDYGKLLEILQFGFNLVTMSIQMLIANNWYGITVEEKIKGLAAPDSPNKWP